VDDRKWPSLLIVAISHALPCGCHIKRGTLVSRVTCSRQTPAGAAATVPIRIMVPSWSDRTGVRDWEE